MDAAAFLLAAGGGRRFDGSTHKLLTSFRGRPLIAWAVDAVCRAGLDEVYVVWGAVDLHEHVPDHVELVHNPLWETGQASSLRAAVGAAQEADLDAIVVGLADQPMIDESAWRLVAASSAPIAVATYEGLARNPVRLHRSVWSLLPSAGDHGARDLVRDRSDLVEEIPCAGNPADIDTLEDLSRWS